MKGGRVLDIGCGPGAWCIDLAQQYPDIQVIGVDMVDMFPDQSSTPPNCRLLVYNVLDGLQRKFPPQSFDCVHIRFMCFAFTLEQYVQVIDDCWQLLKPGGYLQLMEMDMMVYSPGPVMERLNQQSKINDKRRKSDILKHDTVAETARSRGLKPRLARRLPSLLPKDAVNRIEKYRSLPIGIWGGRIGVLFREDLVFILTHTHDAVRQYQAKCLGIVPASPEEFQQQIDVALRELDQYHSYSNFHFVVAQKPDHVPPATIKSS